MAVRFKIKEITAAKGWSRYKLHQKSGVDERTLRKIWHQDAATVVNSDTLDRIATALGVDISELIESIPPDDDDQASQT
jgi:DNA-binding Xre family transcriptional regulator